MTDVKKNLFGEDDMHYSEEFVPGTGPTDPNYDPAKEQAENLKTKIGADLYSALSDPPTLRCDGQYVCDGWFQNKQHLDTRLSVCWVCCPWCGGKIEENFKVEVENGDYGCFTI